MNITEDFNITKSNLGSATDGRFSDVMNSVDQQVVTFCSPLSLPCVPERAAKAVPIDNTTGRLPPPPFPSQNEVLLRDMSVHLLREE